MQNPGVSRRSFIKSTTVAAGAVALGGLIPSKVLGANDRVRIGVIGCGNMGTGHLHSLVNRSEADNLQVVGVCDVFQKRATRAQGITKAEACTDYRRLLERSDIDAILIATPDHWHSKLTIDAMKAGKHVYCEKPMTHSIDQALEVRNAARRYKKILQVGPNATASDSYWKAHEAIKQGRIGKVTWAQACYNRNSQVCGFNGPPFEIDPAAGPDKTGENHIDWDMWLGWKWGLAPKIPWNPEHFFRFRKYWPYSGGVATDLLYHKLAPLLLAVSGPNGEYPLRVNANGGVYIEKDGRDIPDTFLMTVDYPSEWSVFLVSTLTNNDGIPDRIYGKHGTLELSGEPVLKFNGEFKEQFKAKNDGKEEARLALEPRRDLEGNWVDAIRGKGAVHCNVDLGTTTLVAIQMAVDSYRQHKTLRWDAHKEKVVAA
jgi:predicted dehydrogenase